MYCTAAISLLSRWVLENLFGISYLFLGDFRFQGKDKSFHIFTGSLRALTFQFCCGSFTIRELLHHGRRAGQVEMTEIQVVSGKTNLISHIETY